MAGPSFIEWLHAEASGDPTHTGHFAALYPLGPYLDRTFGVDSPEPTVVASYLSREGHTPDEVSEMLRLLALAEATWRTDSIIPDAKVPAVATPPCGYRGIDGVVCGNPSVEGAARCVTHGGSITDPQTRASMLLVAYAQMVAGADTAVQTLLDVMERSTNDLARVQAAKEMLDRAGLAADQHVQITTTTQTTREDVLDRVKAILDSTKERLLPPAAEGVPIPVFEDDDDEILEAELVE